MERSHNADFFLQGNTEGKAMWEVEYEQGAWVASWNGDWLPNTYQSREEAMEALLDYLTEWFGEE